AVLLRLSERSPEDEVHVLICCHENKVPSIKFDGCKFSLLYLSAMLLLPVEQGQLSTTFNQILMSDGITRPYGISRVGLLSGFADARFSRSLKKKMNKGPPISWLPLCLYLSFMA
ncbi:hypothetical protein ACJX0J_020631, partial [Zea mays]